VENTVKLRSVTITVGTLGVMTLEGKEIYLSDQKIPVPRYIYKIISTQSSGKSDVYVVYNNPYANVDHVKAEISEVFGNKVKFFKDGFFTDVLRGYTFKMEYNDFKKVTNEISKGFPLPRNMKKFELGEDLQKLSINEE
jgi:hypothetical protein